MIDLLGVPIALILLAVLMAAAGPVWNRRRQFPTQKWRG
jgi:hypothetical protein